MPGNGNGGGGGNIEQQLPGGHWSSTGEGGQEWVSGLAGKPWTPPAPPPPPPKYGEPGYVAGPGEKGFVREARNVQRANIDRSSLYDPTSATQALGADYLQQRNASNPQPLGSTGAGAVGYDFTPSNERLY